MARPGSNPALNFSSAGKGPFKAKNAPEAHFPRGNEGRG